MSPWLEMVLRLLLAIALGEALFTVVSVFGFSGAVDPSRVAAGVVAGVGFIGAGVIFHGEEGAAGLTTAASIWVTAAIGFSCRCRALLDFCYGNPYRYRHFNDSSTSWVKSC